MPRGGHRPGAGRKPSTGGARRVPVAFRVSEQVAGEALAAAREDESLGDFARRVLEEWLERRRVGR